MRLSAELILFGTGDVVRPLSPAVASYLAERGIGYEVLQSTNAAATFNLLSEEQRFVMAAIVPYGREVSDDDAEDDDDPTDIARPSAALRREIEDTLRSQ